MKFGASLGIHLVSNKGDAGGASEKRISSFASEMTI